MCVSGIAACTVWVNSGGVAVVSAPRSPPQCRQQSAGRAERRARVAAGIDRTLFLTQREARLVDKKAEAPVLGEPAPRAVLASSKRTRCLNSLRGGGDGLGRGRTRRERQDLAEPVAR